MIRLCPRCQTALEHDESSALTFCAHCGAPQVLLSRELLDLAEAQQTSETAGVAPAGSRPEDPTAVHWKPLLQLAFAVSAALAIFVLAMPPLCLLVPGIVLALYSSRYRHSRVTTGLGARIGLLCGVLVAGLVGAMSAVSSALMRLRTPGASPLDEGVNTIFQQWRDQLTAQQVPDVAGVTAFLNIPEFRAGIILCAATMTMLFFLAAISAAGAVAGFARSRVSRRPAL